MQFASVIRNPEITVQFALSPMLISLDSPDDPFNHVLRMTVLIWCPTRFTFKGAVDVGRRGPDGGLTTAMRLSRRSWLMNVIKEKQLV